MTEASDFSEAVRRTAWPTLALIILGAALSAFFDGILLHQVLQWHHLLSLADGATWRDLHNQILADGLFHLMVYLVAVLGLALLWRGRSGLHRPGGDRRALADLLVGFGLWNVVDVVGFHWLAGIHPVRMDVADPLPWDLAWLAVLGFVPLAAGVWLRRRPGAPGSGRRVAALVSIAIPLAGFGALVPTGGGAGSLVVFRPDISPNQALAAAVAAGATISDVSPSGRAMIVVLPDAAAHWSLYRDGALLVGGSGPAGCATRPA